MFHVKALSKVFRAKYLDGLNELILDDKLDIPDSYKSVVPAIRAGNTRRLAKLFKPPWVVYAKRPFASPAKLLDYLSRYVHRTAISNDRILGIDGDDVQFSYRDRADGDRRKTETIPGEEFLRRFLLHVVPKGLTRVRHYGFLSNRTKRVGLETCRRLIGATAPMPEPEQSLNEWFLELTGIDLAACPSCGGTLEKTEIPPTRDSSQEPCRTPVHNAHRIDSS